jgi:hypothetical protein
MLMLVIGEISPDHQGRQMASVVGGGIVDVDLFSEGRYVAD